MGYFKRMPFLVLELVRLYPLLLLVACSVVHADVMPLGFFSFDQLNPGATNNFTVNNLTGPFSLPSDFPVTTAVTFKNVTMTLTDDHNVSQTISIADIGPGQTIDPALI